MFYIQIIERAHDTVARRNTNESRGTERISKRKSRPRKFLPEKCHVDVIFDFSSLDSRSTSRVIFLDVE